MGTNTYAKANWTGHESIFCYACGEQDLTHTCTVGAFLLCGQCMLALLALIREKRGVAQ